MPRETVVHSHELIVRIVKIELPKRADAPAGYHEAEYYTQYSSKDGFILHEHLSTDDELDFFNHVKKANDTQVYMLSDDNSFEL